MSAVIRCIVAYLMAMFSIAFLMALVWPTDVPTPGMEPLPWWEMTAKILAIYGIPLIVVVVDIRYFRKKPFRDLCDPDYHEPNKRMHQTPDGAGDP